MTLWFTHMAAQNSPMHWVMPQLNVTSTQQRVFFLKKATCHSRTSHNVIRRKITSCLWVSISRHPDRFSTIFQISCKKKVCQRVKFNLFNIRFIRNSMTTDAAKLYMNAMIMSHLTYCLTSFAQANKKTKHLNHLKHCINKPWNFWTGSQTPSTTVLF